MRIAAYRTVDELNSAVGVVLAAPCPDGMRAVLGRIQNELFDLGADLSVPLELDARLRVTQQQVDALEHDCDRFNAGPALKSFVLRAAASRPRGSTLRAPSADERSGRPSRHRRSTP